MHKSALKITFLWQLSTLKLCHTKSRLINHHFPYSDIHQNQNTQNTPKAGYPISETPIFYHLTAYPTVNVYINSPFVHHLPRQNLWVFHRVLYVLGYSLYHFFSPLPGDPPPKAGSVVGNVLYALAGLMHSKVAILASRTMIGELDTHGGGTCPSMD
jgi:hypothetical protein